MTYDRREPGDDGTDGDEPTDYRPGLTDRLLYLRYTLCPTLYTDEDSSTDEVLWQHTLELRAARHWLAVLATLLVLVLAALVTLLLRTA